MTDNGSAREIASSAEAFSDATDVRAGVQVFGEQESVWFKLSVLTRSDDPILVLKRFADKLGGCIPVTLKGERIFLLSDVEHFKHVLVHKADDYGKYFEGLTPIVGNSMITTEGKLWQKIRMPQQPAFQPKMYGEYLPYLLASVNDKTRDFERYAASGETINLLEETWGLAASMVCRALFDREVPFNPAQVFGAVKAYTDVGVHRDIRVRKIKGELKEVTLDEALAGIVATWLTIPPALIGAVPANDRDLTLLKILKDAAADPNRPEIDEQQVLDEIKQYLWAGTETTALTLNWCLYLLHLHPEAADRIRKEDEDAFGDGAPTPEGLHALHYTRAVIQETMRLYPPVWAIIRVAQKEDEISGHKIVPGDKIVLCPYLVHHSERYWDNPEKFDPSRFSPENAKKRATYSYLPFSAGKRACIGGALSIFENTLALTQLLRRFRLDYAGEAPAKMAATVTLTPKAGYLPFRVHLR